MKYTGLTIDQELEMDQKLFGVAYYETVNGQKKRIDPVILTILKPNPDFVSAEHATITLEGDANGIRIDLDKDGRITNAKKSI